MCEDMTVKKKVNVRNEYNIYDVLVFGWLLVKWWFGKIGRLTGVSRFIKACLSVALTFG